MAINKKADLKMLLVIFILLVSLLILNPINALTDDDKNVEIKLTIYCDYYAPENQICKKGPLLGGVQVIAIDGSGKTLAPQQTNNVWRSPSYGSVAFKGAMGTWDFQASKNGFITQEWREEITTSCEKHQFLDNDDHEWRGKCCPTDREQGERLTDPELACLVRRNFLEADQITAYAVARAESHEGVPTVCGDRNCGDAIGLWQINLCQNPKYKNQILELFNPENNAKAAVEILKSIGWKVGWSTYSSGAYTTYLPEAQEAFNSLSSDVYSISPPAQDNFADLGNSDDEAYHHLIGWGNSQVPPENPCISICRGDTTKRYMQRGADCTLDLFVENTEIPYILSFEAEDGNCDDSFTVKVGDTDYPKIAGKMHERGLILSRYYELEVPAKTITNKKVTVSFRNLASDTCGLAAIYNVRLFPKKEEDAQTDIIKPNFVESIVGKWIIHSRSTTDTLQQTTIILYEGGELQDSYENMGEWEQNRNTIKWSIDDRNHGIKTVYDGTIGTDMKGTWWNDNGEKGDWSADKINIA
jgi:hypothetical protein